MRFAPSRGSPGSSGEGESPWSPAGSASSLRRVRLVGLLGALALGVGSLTVAVPPRPAFPGPAAAPNGPHRLTLVSSRPAGISHTVRFLFVDSFRGLPK